ncbi:thiamine-phosphate kinase [Thermaurantiacus sp.]
MPASARGFGDDAAVIPWPLGLELVATHDMLAEGVHFTPDCPPADIGWKLVAVNLSDLAAMGAKPVAVLMGAGIAADRDPAWARALLSGVRQALDRFGGLLVGGDTILSGPVSVLSLTALGSVPHDQALGRAGAGAGDDLWVSGTIGDAGLGLQVALGERGADPFLLRRYRRPTPRLALGLALRGVATAAMDVSDGLLLDASRLAGASGLGVVIEADRIPLSEAARRSGVPVPVLAAMGDDYELLFTAPPGRRAAVEEAGEAARVAVTRIGTMRAGAGLVVEEQGRAIPRLASLGFEH